MKLNTAMSMILVFAQSALPVHGLESGEGGLSDVFDLWRQEFSDYRKTPAGKHAYTYPRDYEAIRGFSSYQKLLKLEGEAVEGRILEEMGEYPYTAERLYLSFLFCEKMGWEFQKVLREYGKKGDKFTLPNAVKAKYHKRQEGQ